MGRPVLPGVHTLSGGPAVQTVVLSALDADQAGLPAGLLRKLPAGADRP